MRTASNELVCDSPMGSLLAKLNRALPPELSDGPAVAETGVPGRIYLITAAPETSTRARSCLEDEMRHHRRIYYWETEGAK